MGDGNNGINNGKLLPLVIAIIGAFGGGFGSNYLWIKANPESIADLARPDPFTGTQGRALERRIDNVAAGLNELSNRIDRMSPEEVSQRLSLLEHNVRDLAHDFKRHNDSNSH